ncbi:MAG: hypothetical protein HY675_17165 [Chloroflexi bacterium]|nr:hypothetical protein [Chloroflexota bacterium]
MADKPSAGEVRLQVYTPIGSIEMAGTSATRVDNLNGKTICEQWNGTFRGNETFPVIRELLRERFPDARIVPFDELPIEHASVEQIKEAVRQKGCDVFVGGNGG